jgi:peptidyl-prolyl cis-trans isomerase A (cyclophilin A)
MNSRICIFNFAFATVLATLGGCGGGDGFAPQITTVQPRPLAYSQQGVIAVAGVNLNSSMTAATGLCANPQFAKQSTSQLAYLVCPAVAATGTLPLTISDSTGKTLYSGTVSVPQPQVTMTTPQGVVVMELNPTAVPVTVTNFLNYVNSTFYTSSIFHRVIPGFVIQAGGFTSGLTPMTVTGAPIQLETNKGLSNLRGTVAMARTSDPNSATSQFYINLVDNTQLDYLDANNPGYAVFGKVVRGQAVVDAIGTVPTTTTQGVPNVPVTDVVIKSLTQTQ